MFKKCRVVYVVDKKIKDAKEIKNDLMSLSLFDLFFEKEKNTNYNSNDLMSFLNTLPHNSVFIIHDNEYNENPSNNIFYIALPFMSSHVNFPIKVGELVWFYPHEDNKRQTIYTHQGYYLGRVHGNSETEDFSYCFADREDSIFSKRDIEISETVDGYTDKGIYQALQFKEKISNSQNYIKKINSYPENAIINQVVDKNIFLSQIRNYNFYANYGSQSNHSDTTLNGSYNSSLRLTKSNLDSNYSNNTYKNYVEEDLDETTRQGGRVEIVIGEKERIKEVNEEIPFGIRDDEVLTPDYALVRSHGEYCNPSIYNGDFWEKIKTDRLFIVESEEKEKLAQEIFKKDSYSNKNIHQDISKIIITAHSYEDRIIRKNYLGRTLNDVEIGSIVSQPVVNYLSNHSKYAESVFQTSPSNFFSKKSNDIQNINIGTPNITLMSNNITLFSFEDDAHPGDISLINANSESGIPTKISLTKNGSLLLDADRLVIGRNNRKLENLPSLYLGYDINNMESLVRGDSLKILLTELLDTQRESMTLTKSLFEDFEENLKLHYDSINEKLDFLTLENNKQFKKSSENISSFKSYRQILFENTAQLRPQLATIPAPVGPALSAILPLFLEKIFDAIVLDFTENIQDYLREVFEKSSKDLENVNKEIQSTYFHRNEKLSLRLSELEKNIDIILSKFAKTS